MIEIKKMIKTEEYPWCNEAALVRVTGGKKALTSVYSECTDRTARISRMLDVLCAARERVTLILTSDSGTQRKVQLPDILAYRLKWDVGATITEEDIEKYCK